MNKNPLIIVLAIAIGLILIRCNNEENDPDPSKSPDSPNPKVSIQFSSAELSIDENSGEKVIALNLGQPAAAPGTVRISVDTSLVGYYQSVPAIVNGILTLHILKGHEVAEFKITPKNDQAPDEDRRIEFKLKEVSESFLAGTQNKFSLTIKDDERTSPLSYANFIPANARIRENNAEGITLQLHLSESATVKGQVIIKPTSTAAKYGQHFITEPALVDGALTLDVAPGSSVVAFKVIPIDNAFITGEFEINFNISETNGNIKKGTKIGEALRIADDELANKPKGYEQFAGSWRVRKTIEYDALGRIYKKYVETETPGTSTRTETYFYGADGRLEKINLYPATDEIYTWQQGRIVKSEKVTNGVVKSYIKYEYDDRGNIASVTTFYLQPDGRFLMGFQSAYLYFNDGNVYKILLYNASEEGEEPVLISTRTYDGYIDAANPFPMVDILPTVKTQTKLPTIYRIEENGLDLQYNVSYEFGADGLVGKRTATSAADNEVVTYSYYE